HRAFPPHQGALPRQELRRRADRRRPQEDLQLLRGQMNPSGGVAAILPAAGKGRRFGAPKQFLDLQGEPLLLHVARRVASTSVVDALIVVAPPGEEGEVEAM